MQTFFAARFIKGRFCLEKKKKKKRMGVEKARLFTSKMSARKKRDRYRKLIF